MGELKSRITATIVPSLFVVIFGFLAITSSTQQSPTVDESVHLLGGYTYLQWGDYRINPEHPPLAKMWAALPLLGLEIRDRISENPAWKKMLETEPGGVVYPLAREWAFESNDADKIFFYARIQMLIISITLAFFIFVWSRQAIGSVAGAAALFFYGLDPTVLAHSTIVHTDLPLAAWMFIATFFFWRASKELTWTNLILTSATFGLAAVTKHSFVVIAPIWLIVGLLSILQGQPQEFALSLSRSRRLLSSRKEKILVLVALLACCVAAAYLAIWAAYGFRFSAVPFGDRSLFIPRVPSLQTQNFEELLSFFLKHHIFPEALISGYLYNAKVWERWAYFMGELSQNGFWNYFPVAFVVKTPIPTLLLLSAAGVLLLKKWSNAFLWFAVPALVYFSLAILSRFNIGIRHLLPIYPFLFVLIGGAVQGLWREGSRIKKGGLIIVGLWYMGSTLSSFPHYISYFNELAGGAKNGHKVLLDSNLDWGQDLKGLKQWLDQRGIKHVQLAYFGTADPKYYGIDDFYSTENLRRWPGAVETEITLPEHFAISANFLYGDELFLPAELAQRFQRYKSREPVGSIGHSILVFKVDRNDARVYEDGAVITTRLGAAGVAEALLRKALSLNPASADAHYQLGGLMNRKGSLGEAMENYRAVIKLEPSNEKAHFALGNILLRERQLDAALRHYQEAVKIYPNFAEAHHNLGRIAAAQGRMDEAIEHFRNALRAQPEFAEAHESLGKALARQGKNDEAARHYQEALRLLKERRDANRP